MEDDTTSQDYLGDGRIEVKTLKAAGALECKIMEDGEQTGTFYCNYAIKTLPPSPVLFVKNIVCDFYRETKFMLKTVRFLQLRNPSSRSTTQLPALPLPSRKKATPSTSSGRKLSTSKSRTATN